MSNEWNKERKARLEVIGKLLESKTELLQTLDNEIVGKIDVQGLEADILQSNEIELGIKFVVSKIKSCILEREPSTVIEISQEIYPRPDEEGEGETEPATSGAERPEPLPAFSSPSRSFRNIVAKPKLPKLNLQRFNGDIVKFTSFWESFESTVHQNEDLANIDKFNYLNSLLEGPAARAIQGLPVTEANYESAVKLLQERFGNKQKIISSHMEELLKLQTCSTDRANQLRTIYDRINVHVRSLEALGITSEHYGSLLIPIIMSRIPAEISLQIARQVSKDVWSIREVMEVIKQEVDAREMSENINVKDQRTPPVQKTRPPFQGTASSFHVKGQNPIQCVFCEGKHYTAECTIVTDLKVRKERLYKSGRCFICLSTRHLARNCDRKRSCRNCGGSHHQSICDGGKGARKDRRNSDIPENHDTRTVTATTQGNVKSNVLLQMARTNAYVEPRNQVPVRILLDLGSQRSYITNELKDKLGLTPISTEVLSLNTFGTNSYQKHKCDLVKFKLETQDKPVEITALSHPTICSPCASPINVDCYPHLQGLYLADNKSFNNVSDCVSILIGADYYHSVVKGEVIKGDSGPVAVSSEFGWLLSGPITSPGDSNPSGSLNSITNLVIAGDDHFSSPNEEIIESFKEIWGCGIDKPVVRHEPSFEESCNIKNNGERYEVNLPWRHDIVEPVFDSKYTLCLNRLVASQERFKRDPELFRKYNEIFQEQLNNGIIERVPAELENKEDVEFLPHHGVVRADRETTKLRIVYDGSAKSSSNHLSLNERLMNGPNYLPYLLDVLLRFRCHSYALTADIEKAFLQVEIRESDRDKLRFLWFSDIESDKPSVIQFRFCRLPFGLRPSPSILGATIRKHLEGYVARFPKTVEVLGRLFVDDLSCSTKTSDSALDIARTSKTILAEGAFNLRKFNSNSAELRKQLTVELECESNSKSKTTMGKEIEQNETQLQEEDSSFANTMVGIHTTNKILGINWDNDSDELYFQFNDVISYGKSLPVTKRSLLKLCAKLFDPLGALSPFIVRMKVAFQTLCLEGINWDEGLQGGARFQFYSFLRELESLSSVRIPRCYFNKTEISNIELHGFSDASEQAYGCVIYIRIEYEDGTLVTRFVTSKAKVAPLSRQTIPRLELMGAHLLAQHISNVKEVLSEELGMNSFTTTLWVDSYTVLCWICNDKPWKQFVRNRVQQINRLTDKSQWRHCPGVQNPADLPSRGLGGKDLAQNRLWWEGPEFLKLPASEWPDNMVNNCSEEYEAYREVVKNPPEVTYTLAVKGSNNDIHVGKVLEMNRFSNKARLLRVVAYVLRFISNIRKSIKGLENSTDELTVEEIIEAEKLVIRSVQEEVFVDEISYLKHAPARKQVRPPTLVSQFNLFIDKDGIVRAKSRLKHASLSLDTVQPILLPTRHWYSTLIVKEYHEKVFHNGVRETLCALRSRYWILRGREVVKRLLKTCILCRRLEGLPYSTIPCLDLPKYRVDDGPPFSNIGLDFAGPLYVSQNKSKQQSKMYICLFTCLSTRAVHLELVESLDVDTFFKAFRRFSARRGLPRRILSDNAKTFQAASKEVKKILLSKVVRAQLAGKGVVWQFIAQRAAFWGGVWERMVRSVKRCLRKIIGRASLTFDEISTNLVEVESVINSRPITYVYDDTDGISYALTPSHLIYGRRILDDPNDSLFEIVSTQESLTRRAKYHRKILNDFSRRWKEEYLSSLREIVSSKKLDVKPQVSVGDIVVLYDEQSKRNFWKICKVEDLIIGNDKNVRAAKVKVPNRKGTSILTRSLKHLIPLEVQLSECSSENKTDSTRLETVTDKEQAEISVSSRKAKRNAAIIGEIRRRDDCY